jgi:8-oxo-dGTP pyrophosphatase MutT (NUDIX family)
MWQKLSSKEIFKHPRLTLIEDKVLLPNGKKTTYLRYKDDGSCAVSIICKRDDGKILLQEEYSYPPNQKLLQFPGGKAAADEKPKDGANRELREESGLKAKKLTLLGTYLSQNRRSASKFFVFLGTDLVEAPLKGDEEEVIESYWFSESEIDQLIADDKILNAHVLTAWALYKAKHRANHSTAGR